MSHKRPLLRFHDLTHSYFSQNDKNFQQKFSEKEEFRELSLPKDVAPVPARGGFYPQQIMIGRVLNVWDFNDMFQDPGVGKSGGIYNAAINFDANRHLNIVQAFLTGRCNWMKQTIILVPGDAIDSAWTSTYYKYSLDRSSVLPPTIIIDHYERFYRNNVKKSISQLRNEYNNTFFALDEVHDLLNRSDVDKKIYNWYRMFFSILSNIKLAKLTGTPIVEHSSELGLILNLEPGVDMPTIKEGEKTVIDDPWWADISEKELNRYLTGRVTYVKNVQRKARLVYPPEAVPLSQLIRIDIPTDLMVVPVQMSDEQTEGYMETLNRKDFFNVKGLTASLVVVPPQYVAKNGKGRKTAAKKAFTDRFYSKLSDDDFVRTYAAKIATAADIIDDTEGISFVVSKFVEKSGNILEKVLQSRGYSEYKPIAKRGQRKPAAADAAENVKNAKRFFSIRSGKGKINQRGIDLSNSYENRHGSKNKAIMTSPVGEQGISLRNTVAYIPLDPDNNVAGDKQRESRPIRPDSFDDIYNERLASGMSPEDAIIDLTVYRLVAYPKLKLKKNEMIGDMSVDIMTYKHNLEKDYPLERIRFLMRRLAYDAQINIKRNQCNDEIKATGSVPAATAAKPGAIKPSAAIKPGVGKPGAKSSRVLQGQGTKPQVEVSSCNYGYSGATASDTTDRTTYDLLYSGKRVRDAMQDLITILLIENSITITEFIRRIQPKYQELSTIAIYSEITRTVITNPQNLSLRRRLFSDFGEEVYIGVIKDTIFLQTESSITQVVISPDTAIYSNMVAVMRPPITSFISYRRPDFRSARELEDWLSIADPKEVSIADKIEAIESILIDYYFPSPSTVGEKNKEQEKLLTDFHKMIKRRFGNKTIFFIEEPVGRIAYLSSIDEDLRSQNLVLKINNEVSVNRVIVHTLYAQLDESGEGRYNVFNSQLNAERVSILDRDLGKFIRLNPPSAEFYVYSAMLSERIKRQYEDFKTIVTASSPKYNKIYGLVYDPSAEFKIFDDRKVIQKTKSGKDNKATASRGKVCNTYDLEYLVDIAIYLGLTPDKEVLDISEINFKSVPILNKAKALAKEKRYQEVIAPNIEFYKNPRNLILFVSWASVYISEQKKSKEKHKKPLCTKVFDRLQELNQLYYF